MVGSRLTRGLAWVFSLMNILSGSLMLMRGDEFLRTRSYYSLIEWIAMMIGSMGIGTLFLLDRWRKRAKE
jgi:uncharacterized membrane protein